MKRNIELTVSPVPANERQSATRAELRAVAAYLQAMSEDPVDGTITIGHLVVEVHVGRCLKCYGSGKDQNWREPCSMCRGSGTAEPAPEKGT